jgi:hypothetical protein
MSAILIEDSNACGLMDGQLPSKECYAGSNPARRAISCSLTVEPMSLKHEVVVRIDTR